MQLDKSERFKHKYVVRKTTYNHIAKRPLTFLKADSCICINWFPAHAFANYINLLLRDNNLHIFMIRFLKSSR